MRKYQTMRAKIMELAGLPDECAIAVGAAAGAGNVSRPGLYLDDYYYDEDYGDFVYETALLS